ncbi:tetratricopeptide repeat protein [Roseivirga sp. E12]|uniref:tetratricopeptide repeat protein n=1 Tax=Roseivirga sp. E12 TaxID=2819237 RepID=UPI001ABC13FE|nr:tetratricopeptide repeat protein [Roseivirga sp. E12]
MKLLIKSCLTAVACIIINSNYAHAQTNDPVEIAKEYYNQGEFEKAKEEFQKLARNRRNISRIHDTYFKLLLTMEEFDEAEKYLKNVVKNNPTNFIYEVDLGVLYRTQNEEDKANELLENVIKKITDKAAVEKKSNETRFLAQVFFERNFRDKALDTYIKGRNALGQEDLFALDLANVYRLMNKKQPMISEYLNFSKNQPQNLNYVKNSLQRYLQEPADLDTLEMSLYNVIQKEAGNSTYNNLLVWTHLQQKNFSAALRQARALDRRLANNGDNIMNVAMISFRNSDYKTSKKAFGYIIEDFPESPSRRLASRYVLLSEEEVLKKSYPVDTTAIRDLIKRYEVYISESRDVFSVMESQRRIALLQAFQLNEIDNAIETLTSMLEQQVGRHNVVAEAKMDLADIYLLNKEPWESILLYGQVERMFKDEPLGYTAKLKSAKLSYFKGDFELAQSNLDILKLATSREIANDALDLSILIKNNTVFDSTDVVMQEYASIELLLFQNQKLEALQAMDSMLVKYNYHSIVDELLYLRAQTERELGNFDSALLSLNKINEAHYFEILGDDALFLTGIIHQDDLGNTESAMTVYNDLLTKFPGSIFVAEARTRFRELRGDFNNEN